jgi:hypothetical protein
VLLTRLPLGNVAFTEVKRLRSSCDSHSLGTPPAFVLSQDQTLRLEILVKLHVRANDPGRRFTSVIWRMTFARYSVIKDRVCILCLSRVWEAYNSTWPTSCQGLF